MKSVKTNTKLNKTLMDPAFAVTSDHNAHNKILVRKRQQECDIISVEMWKWYWMAGSQVAGAVQVGLR